VDLWLQVLVGTYLLKSFRRVLNIWYPCSFSLRECANHYLAMKQVPVFYRIFVFLCPSLTDVPWANTPVLWCTRGYCLQRRLSYLKSVQFSLSNRIGQISILVMVIEIPALRLPLILAVASACLCLYSKSCAALVLLKWALWSYWHDWSNQTACKFSWYYFSFELMAYISELRLLRSCYRGFVHYVA
jgi:hypothetical protein